MSYMTFYLPFANALANTTVLSYYFMRVLSNHLSFTVQIWDLPSNEKHTLAFIQECGVLPKTTIWVWSRS